MKKVNIFCHLFQKVKHILYRFIKQSEIFQAFISWNVDDYGLQIIKPKIQCLRKFEYYIRSIKKDILNRNDRLQKIMLIYMHSILDWGSFCMNYCINATWHGGYLSVALLRRNEAQVALIAAFGSSALLGLVSLIFLLTIPIYSLVYGVQVRRVCWPIKHSNTMAIEPAFVTFSRVGRCQIQLENEISISIKLVSRRNHEVL